MEKDWVLIYSSTLETDAVIKKQLLENNEIEAVIINKQDSIYKAFGEIELYVLRDKVLKAKQLITI
ncbi:MAG TPA: hypothetical protein ENL09_04245 [Bacteroidetes bacterium]|nr:MAG: hypothetical protein DRI54_04365 [Bacteroidota bacterium]HHE65216.1 hypothetical protein [Bacteroidota bacterium]